MLCSMDPLPDLAQQVTGAAGLQTDSQKDVQDDACTPDVHLHVVTLLPKHLQAAAHH